MRTLSRWLTLPWLVPQRYGSLTPRRQAQTVEALGLAFIVAAIFWLSIPAGLAVLGAGVVVVAQFMRRA